MGERICVAWVWGEWRPSPAQRQGLPLVPVQTWKIPSRPLMLVSLPLVPGAVASFLLPPLALLAVVNTGCFERAILRWGSHRLLASRPLRLPWLPHLPYCNTQRAHRVQDASPSKRVTPPAGSA